MTKPSPAKRRAKKSTESQGAGLRIISLLSHLAEGKGEPSLKELAHRLGLPQSTVHRLLQRLLATDLVERTEAQTYRPGRELFRIASLVIERFDYQKIAHPFLHELWTEWGETSSFCLYKPSTRTAVVVDTIRSEHPLQFLVERHAEVQLPWGSLGRSILAFLPSDVIDAVLASGGQGPLSHRTLPTRAKMREELQRVVQDGCAVYDDRTVLNLAGVAAPVFGPDRSVMGSIGVTMPAARFDPGNRDELCQSVIQCARRLSIAFGYNGAG